MRTTVLGALTLSSLLFAATAAAQTIPEGTVAPAAGPAFGNPGQIVVSGDFQIKFEYESQSETSALTLAPAIDYFLIPNLSLGGQVLFGYVNNDPVTFSSIGLGPRVGFNIPLAPLFSLWPRVGFFFTHVTASQDVGGTSVSRSENFLSLGFFAPFLFHPVQHFFIGFGPSLSGNVAGGDDSDRYLTLTLETVVGGYFDW